MSTVLLTIYLLVWPAIAAAVMGFIGVHFVKEFRASRREGRSII